MSLPGFLKNFLQRANHGHGIDDPNIVYIVFAITHIVKGKATINSEAKKKLMSTVRVEGMPIIEFPDSGCWNLDTGYRIPGN